MYVWWSSDAVGDDDDDIDLDKDIRKGWNCLNLRRLFTIIYYGTVGIFKLRGGGAIVIVFYVVDDEADFWGK